MILPPIRELPPDISFKLYILAKGRLILERKSKKIANEFNAKKVQGFLRIKNDETGQNIASVAFNLRTITPIKLKKEVFRGDFEAVFAKIDETRSSVSGRRRFSGVGLDFLGNITSQGDLIDNSFALLGG